MIQTIKSALDEPYPGRGLILGRADGRAVCAYFIMGRSVNSRNRVFVQTDDGVRTEPRDIKLLADPSLTIYQAVYYNDERLIVGNGDQTDDIVKLDDIRALDAREYEPDPPIYTPRIAGVYRFKKNVIELASLTRGRDGACVRRYYSYESIPDGTGLYTHTYAPNTAPFDDMPVRLKLLGDAEALSREIWDALNAANRISLYVRCTELINGASEVRIINKYK